MDITTLKEKTIQRYDEEQFRYKMFMKTVFDFFSEHPLLCQGSLPVIHSIKKRMKEISHLERKIDRKYSSGKINLYLDSEEDILKRTTDLAGIRILYLHSKQFIEIHNVLKRQIDDCEWVLYEPPTAFTWDPEIEKFYSNLGIKTETRDTFYTSVHYVVKPKQNSIITCEIQIRSLYEEIWGEIDHSLNYPTPTESISCKEQLRVLSKFTSTGTRLLESIFNTIDEYNKKNK